MKVWTTPKGEKLTLGEFLSRWKKGIQQVALTMPKKKQIQHQIRFTYIMLIGFLAGFVVSIIYIKTLWWVAIILFAAIANTIIQIIALYQQKMIFKNAISFEEVMKGGIEGK